MSLRTSMVLAVSGLLLVAVALGIWASDTNPSSFLAAFVAVTFAIPMVFAGLGTLCVRENLPEVGDIRDYSVAEGVVLSGESRLPNKVRVLVGCVVVGWLLGIVVLSREFVRDQQSPTVTFLFLTVVVSAYTFMVCSAACFVGSRSRRLVLDADGVELQKASKTLAIVGWDDVVSFTRQWPSEVRNTVMSRNGRGVCWLGALGPRKYVAEELVAERFGCLAPPETIRYGKTARIARTSVWLGCACSLALLSVPLGLTALTGAFFAGQFDWGVALVLALAAILTIALCLLASVDTLFWCEVSPEGISAPGLGEDRILRWDEVTFYGPRGLWQLPPLRAFNRLFGPVWLTAGDIRLKIPRLPGFDQLDAVIKSRLPSNAPRPAQNAPTS